MYFVISKFIYLSTFIDTNYFNEMSAGDWDKYEILTKNLIKLLFEVTQ